MIFSNFNNSCSKLFILRNLQEQVKKAFWPFTVWINCSRDLKSFSNSRPSASNFKFFSITRTIFSQNDFGNKIPYFQFSVRNVTSKKIGSILNSLNSNSQTADTMLLKIISTSYFYPYWVKIFMFKIIVENKQNFIC